MADAAAHGELRHRLTGQEVKPVPLQRLRALIVGDEAPARQELRHLLGRVPGVEVVGEAAHAREAMELLQAIAYDMVFLDIPLPGGSGLDLARRLGAMADPPAVILVTAYAEHALSAFEVNATDYLLKPPDDASLHRAVQRVLSRRRAPSRSSPAVPPLLAGRFDAAPPVQRLPVITPYRTLLVDPAAICYLEALAGTVRIVQADGEISTRGTLREFQERLGPLGFFRCHRRFLVNLHRVAGLIPNYRGGFDLVLSAPGEHRLPVSRRQSRQLKRLLDL